jgi:hypothetical protein
MHFIGLDIRHFLKLILYKLRNVNYLLNFHGKYPVVVPYVLQWERLSVCTNILF